MSARHLIFLFILALFGASNSRAIEVNFVSGTFPASLYSKLVSVYGIIRPDVSFNYVAMSSSRARCRLTSHEHRCSWEDSQDPQHIDLAGTDSIFTNESFKQFPDLQILPAVAGAIVPVINIPELRTLKEFALRPSTLASIFTGNITLWNDPRILRDQTSEQVQEALLPLNRSIKIFVRGEPSGTTGIFKRTLAFLDSNFSQAVDISGSTSWINGVTYFGRVSNAGVAAGVSENFYSIGYTAHVDAVAMDLTVAGLRTGHEGSQTVFPDASSVEIAVAETGLHPGKLDEAFHILTAEAVGAQGPLAWPFTSYSYLAVRLNDTRPGATCQTREAVSDFLNWFYKDMRSREIVRKEGYAPLTEPIRVVILDALNSKFRCEGKLLYRVVRRPRVNVVGNTVYKKMMDVILASFEVSNQNVETVFTDIVYPGQDTTNGPSVRHSSTSAVSSLLHSNSSHSVAIAIGGYTDLQPHDVNVDLFRRYKLATIPVGIIGFKVIFNLCARFQDQGESLCQFDHLKNMENQIMLTEKQIAEAFAGKLKKWGDFNLDYLNPQLQGAHLPSKENLVLVCFEEGADERKAAEAMLKIIDDTFSWGECKTRETAQQVTAAMMESPMSLAIVPSSISIPSHFQEVRLHRHDGPVDLSAETTIGCIAEEDFDVKSGTLNFEKGSQINRDARCYPLVVSLNLLLSPTLEREDCSKSDGVAGVQFAAWWLHGTNRGHDGTDLAKSLLDFGLFPLSNGPGQISRYIDDVLHEATCNGNSILHPEQSLVLLFAPAVAIALILAAAVAMVIHGGAKFSLIMSILQSEEMVAFADITLGVADIAAFTISVYQHFLHPHHVLGALGPICLLFIVIGWTATIYAIYTTALDYHRPQKRLKAFLLSRGDSQLARIAAIPRNGDEKKVFSSDQVPQSRTTQSTNEQLKRKATMILSVCETPVTDSLKGQVARQLQKDAEWSIQIDAVVARMDRLMKRMKSKKDDVLAIICEALPVALVQFYLIIEGGYADITSVISLALSFLMLGVKARGMSGYSDLQKELDVNAVLLKKVSQPVLK